MNNPKISVIIPIYNTEKYLAKCLDSIIMQQYSNLEVILVNDGSPDNSERICNDYINKFSYIKYYKKANGGQGSARNLGLKKATGDYIMYVDSDDFLANNAFEILSNKVKTTDCDIIYFDYYQGTEDNFTKCSSIFNSKYSDKDNYLLENVRAWNCIIRREFLLDIKFKFPENIIYEDLAVIPIMGIRAKTITHISDSLYFYLIRNGSSMQQKEYSLKLENIFEVINTLIKNYKILNNNYDEIFEFIIIRRLMSASLRFIEFNDPNNCIDKIADILNKQFPNWSKNKYFKQLRIQQRLVAYLAFNRKKQILTLVYQLKLFLKKRNNNG